MMLSVQTCYLPMLVGPASTCGPCRSRQAASDICTQHTGMDPLGNRCALSADSLCTFLAAPPTHCPIKIHKHAPTEHALLRATLRRLHALQHLQSQPLGGLNPIENATASRALPNLKDAAEYVAAPSRVLNDLRGPRKRLQCCAHLRPAISRALSMHSPHISMPSCLIPGSSFAVCFLQKWQRGPRLSKNQDEDDPTMAPLMLPTSQRSLEQSLLTQSRAMAYEGVALGAHLARHSPLA